MQKNQRFQVAGSILGGDLLNLESAIRLCERAGVDLHQLDICDGHFVPTISFGEAVVKRTVEVSKIPVEVHLMVSRPEDWLSRMAGCGQFRMIFHVEACHRTMGMIQSIERAGMKAGIAVNPETPVSAVETLLPYVDNVCLMGIAPGFAGQTMLDITFNKVADLKRLIDECSSSATITVDGGVKASNAKRLVDAGADILVVSSGIFGHVSPEESVKEIRAAVVA